MKELKYVKNIQISLFFFLILFSTIIQAQNNALVLNGAVTVLNGGTAATPIYIVVNQNNPLGIVRNGGHIHSENQYNYVRWVAGTNTGNYVIPFGVGANLADYIPFTFNKTTAGSSNIQTSTWFTNVPNFPKPAATNVGPVTNMFNFADSVQYAIDRFWDIQAVATADLTFSYRGVENTTINPTGNVRTQHWNGTTWDAPVLPGNPGVTAGIGSAGPFVGQTTFSPWVLSVIPICEQDTITYNGPFCNNITTLQTVTHTGTFTGTFTALPAGLSINPSTGAINPSLSTAGTYTVTFTVAATPTCPQMIATTTVTITALDDASFTYSPTTFCITGTNPTPAITGTTGGTFTMTAPGSINPSTGEINLITSGLGTFMVYYNTTSAGNPCPSIDSAQVTITAAPSASFSYDAAQYCQDAVNPILTFGPGASGGVFSTNPSTGLTINTSTGAIDLSTSSAGIYTVYNTIAAAGGCAAALDSTTIEILQVDSALFNYSPSTFCLTGTNPTPAITGTTGGTFTITAPGVINATTGEIDLSASGLGTYTVYYNTTSAGNPCPSIDSAQVTITAAPSASFSYDAAQYCQDAVNPILTFGPGASGGVFSTNPSTGLTINTSTGAIDLSTSSAGIYTVYNTIAAAGGCAAALDSTTIEILQVDSALFNYSPSTFCLTGTNPTPAITGTTGGTFTITAPGVINATTGEIDLSASGLGTYTIYYNTTSAGNPCPSIDSMVVNIVNAPGATFTYNNSPYCQGDANELPIFGPNNFAGTFTATPAGLLFISSTTGELDLTNSSAGTYMVYNNLAASGGCAAAVDSFQITINPSFLIIQTAQICQGDSILLGGVFQTNSGVYTDSFTTINGCDSVITTTLTVNPTIVTPVNAAICQGDSILLGGAFQTVAGTYYDSLTTSLGCDSVLATALVVNPLSSIIINPVFPVCFGDPIILTATGSGNGTITWYSDSAGTTIIDTGSTIIVNSTALGTFTFYANEVGTCSSGINSVTVLVGGVQAIINATPTTGPAPLNVTFGNGSTTGAGISYSWNFGDGATDTVFQPSHTYGNLGSYTVTLIVTDGVCPDTVTVVIEVFGESSILIPNVFTPNGDGSNDFFSVFGENLIEVKGEIFNRWGQKMFAWDNVNGKWDGRTLSGNEVPDGTYFYIIEAKGVDGKEYFEKGTLSLIR